MYILNLCIPGSAAARIQGFIGNAVAGSIFSILQSAATGGAGALVVNRFVVAGAGFVAIGTAATMLDSMN